jgi:branched-chain amino acid transport system substrate-binding protein
MRTRIDGEVLMDAAAPEERGETPDPARDGRPLAIVLGCFLGLMTCNSLAYQISWTKPVKSRCLLVFVVACSLAVGGAVPAQASDDMVRIGVLDDFTSVFSDSSGRGNVVAAQLAIEDFGGKAAGRKIEVIWADHKNKPDVGVSIAREWFENKGVDAVVGLGNSSVALAVSELGQRMDRAILASGSVSSLLTGAKCNAVTVQWTLDGYSLAKAASSGLTAVGGNSWYFITVDYAFGHDLEENAIRFVQLGGGKVLGAVRHPLNTSDFASFILQAQSSGANIVALANGGQDTATAIKQAKEFGLIAGGQTLVALTVTIDEVHGLGLAQAAGIQLVTPFYWDMNEGSRAWSHRFAERMNGKMPSMMQAGAYGAMLHYLKAVDASSTVGGAAVVAKMKQIHTDDPLFGKGLIRQDGRKLHNMYLFQVKTPEESKAPWDYQKLRKTIPAEQAFRPLSEGNCPLVSK